MAFEVVMPRLGWNMETGRLGEWLKRDGEYVEAGQALFTVESDKAIQEMEALESGVLRIPPDSPPPGKEVPVGTLLAYLLAPGEPLPLARSQSGVTELSEAGDASVQSEQPVAGETSARTSVAPDSWPTISPRARRIARELGVDWKRLAGSGRTGRIVERDVRLAAAGQPAVGGRVSPLARRRAADLGVDLNRLVAQWPGKRIEVSDVEAAGALASQAVTRAGEAAPSTLMTEPERPPETARATVSEEGPRSSPPESGTVSPISFVRRTIAERMAASARTTAPVTLTSEVDATELVRLRNQLKADSAPSVPTYTDLIVKLSAQAMLEHPAINARLEGDTIVYGSAVNTGIAVDTERGLLVPVLRDVQDKSLRQVARESALLIEKARAGRIGPDDLRGGTFTVTNLGMYGIDAFTPIINLPECAILGMGRIVPKQVVIDAEAERLAIRHMMFLSLTFDHRLIDGGPAARFLQRISQLIAQPYLWLAG